MKNYFWKTAIFCCVMIASVAMTACGGDNDEPSQPSEDTKAVNVSVIFNYNLSQDVLDYCDVVMTYNDGTGEKTETMTSPTWSKVVTGKLPNTFTFSRKVTLKSGKDLSQKESVTVIRGYSYSYQLFNADGKPVNSGNYNGTSSTLTMSGSSAIEMVNDGRLDDSHTCTFNANGSLVQ